MVESVIRRLEQAGMIVAGACVTAMMLIVSIDAASRYLLRAPLPWSFDFVTFYLLVGATYFALSSTFRHGDHISINLLHARLPPRARAWADLVTGLLAGALFAVIAYTAFGKTFEAYVRNEVNPGYIMWPVWLSYLPIALGAALFVLRLAQHCVLLATRGEDPHVLSESAVEVAE